MSAPTPPQATSPVQVADYDVVRQLDREGATYLLCKPPARLCLSDEFVTVKVVDGRHDPDRFRRMTLELKAFASVASEHLVRLFDAGSDDGRLWYSMRHHAAGSLAQPSGSVGDRERVLAVASAARGAHALHEAGLAHRDIKPANVLLGPAVLADLELARVLDPGTTVTRTAPVGDLEFADPAMVRGERASRASDVWALGVTLHRSLSHTSIYPRLMPKDSVLQAIRIIMSDGPTVAGSLPDALAEVIRACLSPDPADRPATAVELADELERIAG